MATMHDRNRYLQGCRCDHCRKANSDYKKLRRSPESVEPVAKLQSVPEQQVREPGPCELGVMVELEGLSTAAKRPGLAESALAMARLLDSPMNTAQHPGAQNRLQAALAELRKGTDSRRSWLADVRKMTPRTSSSEVG